MIVIRETKTYEKWIKGRFVILLCGSDKSTQRRDIETAVQMTRNYEEE